MLHQISVFIPDGSSNLCYLTRPAVLVVHLSVGKCCPYFDDTQLVPLSKVYLYNRKAQNCSYLPKYVCVFGQKSKPLLFIFLYIWLYSGFLQLGYSNFWSGKDAWPHKGSWRAVEAGQ